MCCRLWLGFGVKEYSWHTTAGPGTLGLLMVNAHDRDTVHVIDPQSIELKAVHACIDALEEGKAFAKLPETASAVRPRDSRWWYSCTTQYVRDQSSRL